MIDRVEDETEVDDPFIEDYLIFAWGVTRITDLNPTLLRDMLRDFRTLLPRLKELDLGQVAISQRQCEQYLTSRLNRLCRNVGGGKIAKSVGVAWDEFRRWLADPQLIPDAQKKALTTVTTISFDALIYHDWERAAVEAQAVLDLRSDLCWPFTVLGRYNERRGDIEAAVEQYQRAIKGLGTSQDFTAAWSVLTNTRYKFAAGRLMELSRGTSELSDRDHYLEALATSKPGKAVRQYWFERAERAEKAGDFRGAYECYYKSGWDNPISDEMDLVLDELVRTAREAGSAPLSSLAARHRLALSA